MNEQKLDLFEAVIDEYGQGLFRFAFFRTGSVHDSEDIVQGVFLRLYNRHRDFAAIENIKSYLYRSVSNACSDWHRRKQSQKTVPMQAAQVVFTEPSDSHDYDNDAATREYKRINILLDVLPRAQAEVIRMHIVDSLTLVEIATILQIPTATAKSRFRYGIEKLRSKIEKTIPMFEIRIE